MKVESLKTLFELYAMLAEMPIRDSDTIKKMADLKALIMDILIKYDVTEYRITADEKGNIPMLDPMITSMNVMAESAVQESHGAELLQKIMKALRISQKELFQELEMGGTNSSYLSLLINGKKPISKKNAVKFSEYFNQYGVTVPPEKFLSE